MGPNSRIIPLEKKTVLTPEEAEAYTGISINRLWQMSNEPDCNFIIRDGKQILFKRKLLMVYIKIKGPTLKLCQDTEFEAIAQNDYSAKMLSSMGEYKKLNRILQDNGGVILTSQVVDAGIDKTVFYDFIKRIHLKKADNGVYVLEELYADKLYMLHLSFENAVFSHETALFFHGLIDSKPSAFSATTKTHSDGERMRRFGITVHTLPECLLEIGVTKVHTPHNHLIPIYDMERTICDIIYDWEPGKARLLQDILERYDRKENKKLGRLMKYAKVFHIENEVQHYLMTLSQKRG